MYAQDFILFGQLKRAHDENPRHLDHEVHPSCKESRNAPQLTPDRLTQPQVIHRTRGVSRHMLLPAMQNLYLLARAMRTDAVRGAHTN